MMEKIKLSEVEKGLPSGTPAKIRALNAEGNSIVINGNIPLLRKRVVLSSVGEKVATDINYNAILLLQNKSNATNVSIVYFIDNVLALAFDSINFDLAKTNPSKQVSIFAEDGIIKLRLNHEVSRRSISIWPIPLL